MRAAIDWTAVQGIHFLPISSDDRSRDGGGLKTDNIFDMLV